MDVGDGGAANDDRMFLNDQLLVAVNGTTTNNNGIRIIVASLTRSDRVGYVTMLTRCRWYQIHANDEVFIIPLP